MPQKKKSNMIYLPLSADTVKTTTIMVDVLSIMEVYFKFKDFKNETQAEAVKSILLDKYDVFVSMPDGYGRSLCYKLPALVMSPKVTIVFCSHLVRSKKNVKQLTQMKICSQLLTAETDHVKRQRIMTEIINRTFRNTILYVAPSEADSPDFMSFLKQLVEAERVAFIVVDEIQVEYTWLYDIKNDYIQLRIIRNMYPWIKWVVISSEINGEVVSTIKHTLNLKTDSSGVLKRIASSGDRSNIFYDFQCFDDLDRTYTHIETFIEKCLLTAPQTNCKVPCGLIFCKTKEISNTLSAAIHLSGTVTCSAFHSGLATREQSSVRNAFMRGTIQVLVIAENYGTAINNPNIRFVIHVGLPSSITEYYKEIGLAGQDGLLSRCRIYETYSSLLKISNATEQNLWENFQSAKHLDNIKVTRRNLFQYRQLCHMRDYCLTSKCKHQFLATHFGDVAPQCNTQCDGCLAEYTILYTDRKLIKKYIIEKGEYFLRNLLEEYEFTNRNELTINNILYLLKVCDEFLLVLDDKFTSPASRNMFKDWQQKVLTLQRYLHQLEENDQMKKSIVKIKRKNEPSTSKCIKRKLPFSETNHKIRKIKIN